MTPAAFHRDGLTLVLHVTGPQDAPLVAFQHGLCGDARQPAEVFPTDRARLMVLECRGHGQSPAGDLSALSIATFTDDLAAAIEAEGQGPIVVGGISMGAAIALRLAVTRPDLCRALILARPAWGWGDAPPNMAPNLVVGQRLANPPVPDEAEAFRAGPTGQRLLAEAPDNLASLMGFFSRNPRDVTAALLTRISLDGPGVSRAQVAALRLPALVIGHGQDAVHPLALARDLAAAIPGARFAEIPPKAQDKPAYVQAFRAALSTFLTKVSDAQT